jgi:hypothetical protein
MEHLVKVRVPHLPKGEEVLVPIIPLPSGPRGNAVVVRVLVTSVPALLVVIFAGLILLIGLFMGERRQRYALRAAQCGTDLVKSMIGFPGP